MIFNGDPLKLLFFFRRLERVKYFVELNYREMCILVPPNKTYTENVVRTHEKRFSRYDLS